MKFTARTYRVAIQKAEDAVEAARKDVDAGYGTIEAWLTAVNWERKLIQRQKWNKRRKAYGG